MHLTLQEQSSFFVANAATVLCVGAADELQAAQVF